MMDEKALIRLNLRSRKLYRWELRQGRVNVDLDASTASSSRLEDERAPRTPSRGCGQRGMAC